MPRDLIQKRALISGRVQGVSYRASTARKAAEIGELKGHVKNLPDGRVEVVAQGEAEKVVALLEWCRQGPPGARVTGIEVSDETPTPGLEWFAVRY